MKSFVHLLMVLLIMGLLQPLKGSMSVEDSLIKVLETATASQFHYPDSTRIVEESALRMSKDIDFPEGMAQAYNRLAFLARNRGEIMLSWAYCDSAITIAKKSHLAEQAALSNNAIGMLLYYLRDFENARKYMIKSVTTYWELNDYLAVANGLNNLGMIASQTGYFNQARQYYQYALEIREFYLGPGTIIETPKNIAGLLLKQGQYRDAANLANRLLIIRGGLTNSYFHAELNMVLGEALFRQSRLGNSIEAAEEALKLIKVAIVHAQKVGAIFELNKAYDLASEILDSLQRPVEASIIESKKAKVQLTIIEQSNKVIKGMADRRIDDQKEISKLKLDNERVNRNLLLVSILVVTVVALQFYSKNRTKRLSNQKLHASLEENQVLLHEVHHRVKNNLQIVSALLFFQIRDVNEEETSRVLGEVQARLDAICMLHQMFYLDAPDNRILVRRYVEELVEGLKVAFGTEKRSIKVLWEVEEFKLSFDHMVSLGLIINELVVNALKHAFQDKEEGEIEIYLASFEGEVHLVVKDDGGGLKRGSNSPLGTSTGMTLIQSLGKKLNGVWEFYNESGWNAQFRFQS